MNPLLHRLIVPAATLLVLLTILAGFYHELNKRDTKVRELQNEIAARDVTVQLREGLFTKQAHDEAQGLRNLLDGQDAEMSMLKDELKKRGDEVLTLTTANVRLKDQLAQGKGTQTTVVSADGKTERKRVDFETQLSFLGAKGYTLTDPPEYRLELKQLRPLRLAVALTREKDGSWRTFVTSSEKDLAVDIGVGAVDTSLFDRRWYERLGLGVAAGLGGGRAVAQASLLLDLGRFELGPSVWSLIGETGSQTLYGASLVWRPFSARR